MRSSPPSAGRPTRASLAAVAAALCVWSCVHAGPGRPASRPTGDPTPAGQRLMYFPLVAKRLKLHRTEGVMLWTDAPQVSPEALVEVAAARRYLTKLLPPPLVAPDPPAAPARPVALAVYAAEDDYHDLWKRVGQLYGGTFGKITTDGYSYRHFCATFHGDAKGFAERKAVLCHEFAHVWLFQRRGLRNDGNWLTEGIATAVQLRFSPRSGDRRLFLHWMNTGRMLPLKRLMDQDRLRPKDYWQAATLVETLAKHHGRDLPAVIAAFNAGRSAYAIVRDVLETDFPTLAKHWSDHVRASAAGATTRPAAPEGRQAIPQNSQISP